MKYRFYIVDVFSSSAFGGNQLAVLPEAFGISAAGMQKIAHEFNFPETTFVLPPADSKNTRQVRIFTSKAELPFAGHPTVGTACVLAMGGYVGAGKRHHLLLEEGVGPVAVDVDKKNDVLHGTLMLSPKIATSLEMPSRQDIAGVLSLKAADVKRSFFASVGLPFCFVHLVSCDAVDRAAIDKSAWRAHLAEAWSSNVFFFAGNLEDRGEIYARMSAPALGMEEDPATGSACAALVAKLAADSEFSGGPLRLSITQGVAMGRRSDIEAVAHKSNGIVTEVKVSGATSYVASGEIEVPSTFLLQP